MNLFKEVADIKTADQLNLPTPEVEYHNIVAQPTEHQQEMVKTLSERASLVHSGTVDPVSYTHLFGCGEDGDVIDFTAKLFDLSPKEAAEKLAQDFGLIYDSQAPPCLLYTSRCV